jgi:hypothetical protein
MGLGLRPALDRRVRSNPARSPDPRSKTPFCDAAWTLAVLVQAQKAPRVVS